MTTSPRPNLDCLFAPRSIAIIGASSDPTRIGGRPIAYLKRAGFAGAIFPVNPERPSIQGLASYPAIDAVPGSVDLAIIAVRGEKVLESARACAAHGVKSLVVFSAGFAETGAAGRVQQEALASIGRQAGMRINGPNSLGLFNAHIRAFPTFSVSVEHCMPASGRIAIATQSGGYGGYVLKLAHDRGLQIGNLITTGNECDVEIGETLHWLVENPDTEVVLAYMEGCRDGAALIRAFEAAARVGKPVVVIKVGMTEEGAAAVASHTAALSGSDQVFDEVFREYGVYRARHTEEMLDIAYALQAGKRPRNRRLALLTVSGGIGVHMSDLAAAAELSLPPLSAEAQEKIRALVPFAATRNPLDVTGQVANDPTVLGASLDTVMNSGDYGSTLVFLGHAGSVPSLEVALNASLCEVAERFPDRLIACSTTSSSMPFANTGVLAFPDPVRAIAALKACAFFGDPHERRGFSSQPRRGDLPLLDWDRQYNEREAKELLKVAGVHTPLELLARDPHEVALAARSIEGPVALKIVSPDLLHKSDVGGVALGIRTPEQAQQAAVEMLASVRRHAPEARIEGLLVSEMICGVEFMVGVHPDPVFGPVVVCGAGGVAVELLRDVSRRLAPVNEATAVAMIRQLRTFPLLDGYRGRPRADLDALARAIASVSELAAVNADRLEALEVNPLIVRESGRGAIAVDCVLRTRRCP